MKNNLVSLIVPIYNASKYIEKCTISIVNQTYKNIEIILVDDGSTDNSLKIIKKLAKTDKRIKIIHQSNQGVSSARNKGLDIATGKYITFIDADDYLEPDYVEYFMKIALNNDLIFNYAKFNLKNLIKNNDREIKIYQSEKIIQDIYLGKMDVAVWNKFYKKEFLDKYNIRFIKDIWYGEGMLFNITCLKYVKTLLVGNYMVYHQVFNPSSATRDFNLQSNYCGIKSLYLQKEILNTDNKKILNALNYHLRCFNISILKGIIKTNSKEKYIKEYKECIRNLRHNITIPFKVPISVKQKIKNLLIIINPVFIIKHDLKKEKKQLKNTSI